MFYDIELITISGCFIIMNLAGLIAAIKGIKSIKIFIILIITFFLLYILFVNFFLILSFQILLTFAFIPIIYWLLPIIFYNCISYSIAKYFIRIMKIKWYHMAVIPLPLMFIFFITILLQLSIFNPANSRKINKKTTKEDIVQVKFDQETFNTQRQLCRTSDVKNYYYYLYTNLWGGFRGTIIVRNGYYDFGNVFTPPYYYDFSSINSIYYHIENKYKEFNMKPIPYEKIGRNLPPNYASLIGISVKYDGVVHIPVEIDYIYE